MKNNTKKIALSLKVKMKNFFSFHHATAVVNEKIEKPSMHVQIRLFLKLIFVPGSSRKWSATFSDVFKTLKIMD